MKYEYKTKRGTRSSKELKDLDQTHYNKFKDIYIHFLTYTTLQVYMYVVSMLCSIEIKKNTIFINIFLYTFIIYSVNTFELLNFLFEKITN